MVPCGNAGSLRWVATVFAVLLASAAEAAFHGPPSSPQASLPSDVARIGERILTASYQEYGIWMGGNVDGVMTRHAVSHSAFRQGWQPNIFARIENIGETDVINPWLVVNGRGDWRTIEKIVEEAVGDLTSESDRARSIWEWHRKHRFHASTWDRETDDAVKTVNVYGYTLCADDAIELHQLWQSGGFKTRHGYPMAHATTEVFYDNAWHMMDGDTHLMCLKRDNKTIAGEADLVRDHDLIKRSHTYSIGQMDDPLLDQTTASLYCYEGDREDAWGDFTYYPYENSGAGFCDDQPNHSMNFILRPGESLEWRWSHVGKEYSSGTVAKPGEPTRDGVGQLSSWGATSYDNLRNGKWTYHPPIGKAFARRGMLAQENLAEGTPDLRPAKAGEAARVAWKIRSPYIFVGGMLKLRFTRGDAAATFRVNFSADGQAWAPLYTSLDIGAQECTVDFDERLSPPGHPMYEYFIAVEMKDASLQSVELDNDVQMAMLAMPELTLGDNSVVYTDDSPGERTVKVTHRWVERSAWHPPAAPAVALSPRDGAQVEGTKVRFRWSPAKTAPSTHIDYYRIQLSDRPDMRWPLSTNFDKLLINSSEMNAWTIPAGLLNPGTSYYWRVRAKSYRDVWGPWSRTWSFRCAAPGVPVNLQAVVDGHSIKLTWEESPEGRRAVAFRVYGSDEKGFTASDMPYVVYAGRGLCEQNGDCLSSASADGFVGNVKLPSNLVGTFPARAEAIVVGPHVTLPNANKAFYRVVAIDARGNESGPSDPIAMPRPFIATGPHPKAAVGQVYHYRPHSLRSIGDLSYADGIVAFRGWEKLAWTLVDAPSWLQLKDGVLLGTPGDHDVGDHAVCLAVENDVGGRAEQQFVISVGK
jgi:hypothetical protein